MTALTTKLHQRRRVSTKEQLLVALPEPSLSMEQDSEFLLVRVDGRWEQIRLHDYEKIYAIPGLYERVIYDILKCDSPVTICRLLEAELAARNIPPRELRVLDLGAGNGIVGEILADMGVEFIVGEDIIKAAAVAAKRDRPGIYNYYHVADMTQLGEDDRRKLAGYRLNCLICVAALGFGDIPPLAFATAYNLIEPGAWVAFNIKEAFLKQDDDSGFARLIRRMTAEGTLGIHKKVRFQHRIGTDRRPIHYFGIVGTKDREIGERHLLELRSG